MIRLLILFAPTFQPVYHYGTRVFLIDFVEVILEFENYVAFLMVPVFSLQSGFISNNFDANSKN